MLVKSRESKDTPPNATSTPQEIEVFLFPGINHHIINDPLKKSLETSHDWN